MENKKSIFEKLGLIEKVPVIVDEEAAKSAIEQQAAKESYEIKTDEEIQSVDEIDNKNIEDKRSVGNNMELNRFLTVKEVYEKYNLSNNELNSIYIIDSFSKALPQNLPANIKKQSVTNIISTSGMNLSNLLKDGDTRLKAINTFLNDFTKETEGIISENEKEIKLLLEKIKEHEELINERKKLHQEQQTVIEYETQKINEIVDFIASSN